MRGKDEKITLEGMTSRITPAYAGKSKYNGSGIMRYRDHPRLCGEKVLHVVQNFFIPGSPPPMRGKGSKSSVDAGKYRITPAYAGKRTQSLM